MSHLPTSFSDDDVGAEDNNNLINFDPSVPFEWLGISPRYCTAQIKVIKTGGS
jgi:hypothetical protein